MKSQNKLNNRFSGVIRSGFIAMSFVLVLFAVMPNFAQDSSQSGQDIKATEIPPEALREALIEILSQDTTQDEIAGSANSSSELQTEVEQQSRVSVLRDKLSAVAQELPNFPEHFFTAIGKSTTPETGWSGFRILMTIAIISIVGLLIERFTTRKLLAHLYEYVSVREKSTALKYKFIFTRVIIQIIGVVVLAVVAYVMVFILKNDNRFLESMLTEFVGALVMFRVWMILLRNVLSPYRPEFRPISLDDVSSIQVYRWFIAFFVLIEFIGALFEYLTQAGMRETQLNTILIPYTLGVNVIILSRIWALRTKITAMFISETESSNQYNIAREILQTAWPYLLTAWLLSLWMLWLYKAFLGQWEDAKYVSVSWWITLAFLAADRMFYGLVKNVVNIEWLKSPNYGVRSNRFTRIVQNGFRLLMGSVAVYTFSLASGLEPNSVMRYSLTDRVLEHGIDLLVIATITYVVWEFFNALIERNLPEEVDAIAALEGEGGGGGATRAETLLPMMRTFLSVFLVTFVVLSVLNTLGVAITPLLAGAGVIGIAVGFGAQKLVQDVLSGIFFLVDDAFRKNEYIEIENLRGTVEKISLRSMQLRHHLGAVQTIPYGEIKTVKNLSRDWVTLKLELRLSYDTDIEQVRKIIKKVGQTMLEDEEMGPSFILPLKSQGVMRVEESALIVRMKFTTKPGEQWVIRREAYRRVRDALSEAGIYFATREVMVRLPEEPGQAKSIVSPNARETLAKAGAAAAATIAAESAERHGKIDQDDDR